MLLCEFVQITLRETFLFTLSSSKQVFLALPVTFSWNDLTFSWNELTILWNELTLLWNEMTWNEMTMERNDRKPFEKVVNVQGHN